MNNRSKNIKAVEKARKTVRSNERITFDKTILRPVPYFTDIDTGYRNCGSMTYACELCSAMPYLGGKILDPDHRYSILSFRSALLAGKLHHISFRIHRASNVVYHSTTAELMVFIHFTKRYPIHIVM